MSPSSKRPSLDFRIDQAKTALADARVLLANGGTAQSVINRAYYSMFYAALGLLQRNELVPKKHSGVLRHFDKEYILSGKIDRRFSKDIHAAFDLRMMSDYQAVSATMEEARDLVERAQAFIEAAEKLLVAP